MEQQGRTIDGRPLAPLQSVTVSTTSHTFTVPLFPEVEWASGTLSTQSKENPKPAS